MRPCFQFIAAKKADQPDTLTIFDEIGFWGVQAKDFIKDLRALTGKVLNVEINSPGGDVFAGLAIYNALKGSGKEIHVKVMGVAASAASLIMMAGDKRIMPKNTFTMVHNPWSFAMGNADELRDTADTLDKIGDSLQATYVAATGQSSDKIKELLAKDSWLTADESLELGFATEVIDEVKAKASFDMARADLPENVKAAMKLSAEPEPKETPEEEAPAEKEVPVDEEQPANPIADQVETLVKAAGLEAFSASLVLGATTLDEAKANIAAAREIVALCKVAGRPDDAKAAIASKKSVADVRASLIKAKADADEHTDSTVKNQGDASRAGSGVNPQKIWNSHEAQKTRPKKGSK
jgi:ATP-dependent Clp endopeptidase proteolytic subunit ClpP